MIGARKVPNSSEVSVSDLAFFYDEMVKSNLLELEVQTPQGKIVLKRASKDNSKGYSLRRFTDASGPSVSSPPVGSDESTPEIPTNSKTINSPIIGVFYRASSPQSAPFVKEGDVVDQGTTVCLVEAMKVMNEIKTDCRCRILKIMSENTKPVTKDQPLFVVEPAV